MKAKLFTGLKRGLIALLILAIVLIAGRVFVTQQRAPLQLWHTYVPEELSVKQMEAADWAQYLKAETEVFESVRTHVTQQLDKAVQIPGNRYFEGSPLHASKFAQDWNRSFILKPAGKPLGAVVLLHGLTDSPYSVKHVAQRYAERGFVAVAIRLPGHGTVPAGLSKMQWEDWMAATRLAVREARTHIDASQPLHVVGYSNGGALAVKYTLEALDNPQLLKPTRVVLMSPMIGVTRFARFAGLAGVPAILPAFAQAAWLGVEPEFNPFKYNSFPVNGARQSYRLSEALQAHIARRERSGGLGDMPPIMTFQSIVDFTVSVPAIISALYSKLPANGSELVLFDVNRSVTLGPMLSPTFTEALETLLPAAPQDYRVTLVANATTENTATVERTTAAGETTQTNRPLALPYPASIFSLSHIAIPFPMDDPLYGVEPDPKTRNDFGINLGTLAPRGERGGLILSMDSLLRVTSNPFFPYMVQKIEEGMVAAPTTAAVKPKTAHATPAAVTLDRTYKDAMDDGLNAPP